MVTEKMLFKDFSCGGAKLLGQFLFEGLMQNICVKIFLIFASDLEDAL